MLQLKKINEPFASLGVGSHASELHGVISHRYAFIPYPLLLMSLSLSVLYGWRH